VSSTAQAAIAVVAFFLAVGVLAAVVRTFGLALAGLAGLVLLFGLLMLGLIVRSDVLSVAAAVVFVALVVVAYALEWSMFRIGAWRGRSDEE
jgi:hypothetical protein